MREFHPLANIFPLLEGADFDSLVADIKAHGQLEPIVVSDDKILDGRNRYRACLAAGVAPVLKTFCGDDPLAFVISANLRRRHLDESQRAMVAARLATLPKGANQHASIEAPSQEQAADLLNVGRSGVQRARQILDHGTLELVAAVERGDIAVSQAAMLSHSPAEFQQAVVTKVRDAGLKPLEAIRQAKADAIGNRQLAAPSGKYRVLYADPPWAYGNSQPDYYGEARDHYPTMPLADICALPIKDLAEDNAVLFLWATSPTLMEARDVIEAWGFTYKAAFVWDKQKHVMGHYNSVRHELLLICTRGSCQPDVRTQIDSVQSIDWPKRRHSEKPAFFYDVIETLYPYGAKIELFARNSRPGWDAWGNQAPNEDLTIPGSLRRKATP